MALRATLAALVIVACVAIIAPLAVGTLSPDAAAPPAVEQLLPGARHNLASNLDLVATYPRYVGWEHRERDELVILRFELRVFGLITIDQAYVVSRCVPLAQIDPSSMGGGRGVEDFATDPELTFLRSDAQLDCP